jgi:phosphate/sulfate permease
MSAQTVTMATIGLADVLGLPVSTTHVVSSGVAGAITAQGSGLQRRTVRDIALAWLFTFPAAMLLGMILFALFRWLVP